MPGGLTTYDPTYSTTTIPEHTGGGGGMGSSSALLDQILRARRSAMAAAPAPRPMPMSPNAASMIRSPGANTTGLGRGNPNARLAEAAQAAELRAAMAEARAVSQPPPMRMVNGPGIVPGYTMDVNAMTGAQRHTFLPEASQQLPGRPQDEARDARSLGLADRRQAQRDAQAEEVTAANWYGMSPQMMRRIAMMQGQGG